MLNVLWKGKRFLKYWVSHWFNKYLSSSSFGIWIKALTCMCAKSLQLCPTLCDPMDCSLPGSSVQGILQARILEWVTLPSSRIKAHECNTKTKMGGLGPRNELGIWCSIINFFKDFFALNFSSPGLKFRYWISGLMGTSASGGLGLGTFPDTYTWCICAC